MPKQVALIQAVETMEWLSGRLDSLREAEENAMEASSPLLPEIQKMYYATLDEFTRIAEEQLRFLKRPKRPNLGSAAPRIPLEALERMFASLRERAELEWVRSLKLEGRKQRQSRKMADRIGRLAQKAAKELAASAQAVGQFDDDYVSEHGLGPYL